MAKASGALSVTARVVSQRCEADSEYRLMRLEAPGVAERARPGQFLMVRAAEGLDPLLGRPLAVFDVPPGAPGSLEVLYAVVGRGTAIMSRLREGGEVSLLGPLGNGWRVPGGEGDGPFLLVGGGCGVAAVYRLARALGGAHPGRVTLVTAGASREKLLPEALRESLGGVEVVVATEDGSAGLRGTAIDAARKVLDGWGPGAAQIFASGPRGMLKAAAGLAREQGLPLQVSLEERMACGVGACRGCVVMATSPHPETGLLTRTVCADGPVFDAGEIDWEALR